MDEIIHATQAADAGSGDETKQEDMEEAPPPPPDGLDPTELPEKRAADAIVNALKVFDHRCSMNPILATTRTPLASLSRDNVKLLGRDLRELPSEAKFVLVPLTNLAALGVVDADITERDSPDFYQRSEVTELWAEIDSLPYEKVLFVRGQPGTGKSTAISRKVLSMAAKEEAGRSNILWVSINRNGDFQSAVYFQGRSYYKFRMHTGELAVFLHAPSVPLDTVVVDGVTSAGATRIQSDVTNWVVHTDTNKYARAILSSSTKVEELRSHQNSTVRYLTIHSWKLEEFYEAFVQSGKPTKIYDNCSTLFYEEYGIEATDCKQESESLSAELSDSEKTIDSNIRLKQITTHDIFDAVGSRYQYSGGSARWMFNYSRVRIDRLLKDFCNNTQNCDDVLNGKIGPTSKAATNYFFWFVTERGWFDRVFSCQQTGCCSPRRALHGPSLWRALQFCGEA